MKNRVPLNLNEEINRIKKLMEFTISDNSHDVLSEQVSVPTNVYKTSVGTYNLNDLPNAIKNYDPSKGYIRIDGGNEWLANSRANSLKNFLISNLPSKIGVNIAAENVTLTKAEVLGPGNENQYVIGSMYGRMYKPPQKQEKYPYDILYNFYGIGESDTPYILVTTNERGEAAPQTLASDELAISKYSKFINKTKNAVLVKQSTGGSMAGKQTHFTYGILLPIKGGYTAKKKGHLWFDNEEDFKDAGRYISYYTAVHPLDQETLDKPNATQYRFTTSAGGGGNYIFGREGGFTVTVILSNNTEFQPNTQVTVKREESSIKGTIPGETKEGGEEEWFKLGDYKLDQNFFKDNMISLSPDSYDKIFTDIRNLIIQKVGEGFEEGTVEMKAEIKGFASSDNATNRLPQGVEKPDHTYGNRVPVDKWIKVG